MKLSVEGKAVGSLSKSDASIDPRILDSARREFLARGFEGASLQSICADAGVTTGALYKRYKGKADLFEAVVAPTLADIRALEEEAKRRDYALMDDKNLRELWALSEDIHRQWMIYCYERYEGMRLLLCCAEGTAYANFLHDFVARNTALCMEFVNEARRRDLPVSDIDADELHILLTAYWSTVFEPLVHGFPLEKALGYCKRIAGFFNWQVVFGF